MFGRDLDVDQIVSLDGIILAVPAQSTRDVLVKLKQIKGLKPRPLLITAKGIEQSTGMFQSEIIEEFFDFPWTILSGPTFASDVMDGIPCAAVLSSKIDADSEFWLPLFKQSFLRLYLQDDPIGVQIGGCVKNVIAIAAGILTGLGGSESSRAALITRGMAEMVRFGIVFGAKPSTFMGLSGMGDLILTATSAKSRNFSKGFSIGRGIEESSKGVMEGAFTASILMKKSQENNISMPICQAVFDILIAKKDPKKIFDHLINRPLGTE
jgi:glycerol-3-phosphate dehydrogenase (NAD(P)+)